MSQAYEHEDIDPSELTKFGEYGNGTPIYGQVDGMSLSLVPRSEWGGNCLGGCSQNHGREVTVSKIRSHGGTGWIGALSVRGGYGEPNVEFMKESADSLEQLLYQMNRKACLIRQGLRDTHY